MANPITGIVSGTVKTAKNQLQDTARGFASVIPNPAKSVYGLGMGVGPLIRNIVQEINKPKKVSKDKEPATKKEQAATTAEIRKYNKSMHSQMALSVSLLKDIRATLHKQLHAVNRAAVLNAGEAGLIASKMRKGSYKRDLSFDGEVGSATYNSTDKSTKLGGIDFDSIKTFAGVTLGALALGGGFKIWDSAPEALKKEVRDMASTVGDTLQTVVVDNVKSLLGSAWDSGPGGKLALALGGVMLAQVTGVLGAAASILRLGASTTKGAYEVGRVLTGTWGAALGAAPTTVAKATYTGPDLSTRDQRRALEMEKYQELKNSGMKPGDARTAAKDFVAEQVQSSKSPTNTTNAGQSSQVAAAGTKMAGALSTGMKWIGRSIGALGVGYSGVSAYNNYKQGNTVLAGLDAFSAATGALALGAGLTGVGLPVAGVLGGLSALSGAASAVGSMFTDNKSGDQPTVQKPPAGSMGTSNTTNVSGGTIPGIDNQRLLDLVGKFESGGNYNIDNKAGFVGKYQVGAEALETAGLLRPGASKGRNRGPGSAIYDPSSWNSGYTLDGFLNDPGLQDKVASTLMRSNYDQLVKSGVIGPNMSDADIASRLYTAWHGGVGGANALFQNGQAREDFLFKGVTTKTSADKMYAAWNGTGGGTLAGSPSSTTPSTSSAATMAGGISVGNISSPEAMIGSAFADVQDAFNSVASLISGQKIDINMSNIVQNAMQSSGQQSSIASPSRTEPQKTNVALDRAQFATGVRS